MYELVIRGGEVVDGSGLPSYRADIGIRGGRISRIGRIKERGGEEVDARGLVVAPGFIDGHTHMDVVCPQSRYQSVSQSPAALASPWADRNGA